MVACGVLAALGAVGFGPAPAVTAQEGATLRVPDAQIAPEETEDLGVSMTVPRGLQRFSFRIRITDGSVATVSGVAPDAISDSFFRIRKQTETHIEVEGVDLNNEVVSSEEPIRLLTLSLTAQSTGTTEIVMEDVRMFDEGGSPYDVTTEPGTVTIREPQSDEEGDEDDEEDGAETPSGPPGPLPGADAPPQDLDGDGLFEDVNGDGAFTASDVALFGLRWQSEPVQAHPTAFDFNGDGALTDADVFALSERLDAARDADEDEEPQREDPVADGTAFALAGGPFFVEEPTAVTLRLVRAPAGLQSVRLRMQLAGPLQATDVRALALPDRVTQLRRPDSRTVVLESVDLAEAIQPGASSLSLAEITVMPREPGEGQITIQPLAVRDDEGRMLAPFVRPLATVITPRIPPIGESDQPPQDLDGDGLFEDVNGDGALTEADVLLLAFHIDAPPIQQNAELFDFNGDGQISFADVRALAELGNLGGAPSRDSTRTELTS